MCRCHSDVIQTRGDTSPCIMMLLQWGLSFHVDRLLPYFEYSIVRGHQPNHAIRVCSRCGDSADRSMRMLCDSVYERITLNDHEKNSAGACVKACQEAMASHADILIINCVIADLFTHHNSRFVKAFQPQPSMQGQLPTFNGCEAVRMDTSRVATTSSDAIPCAHDFK